MVGEVSNSNYAVGADAVASEVVRNQGYAVGGKVEESEVVRNSNVGGASLKEIVSPDLGANLDVMA